MKSLLIASIALALSLTACSAKTKKEEAAPAVVVAATPKPTATPAPVAAPTKAEKKSKKAKAAKVAAKVEEASTEASATTAASSATGSVTCTKGADTRTLEVKAAGAGCELIYTKKGEAKSVASAKSGMSHCEGISQKIAKNLTDSAMSCK